MKLLLLLLCHLAAAQEYEYEDYAPRNSTALPKPQIYFLHVSSDIRYRYARTVVSSKVANPASAAQQVTFTAVLPETAFISGFLIEVDGKEYNAYVREKQEAKQEYEEAVRHGRTAAHVALNARDSNRFTVSVNVEAEKKVRFNLTYEELLQRRLGEYKHVINLDPGQIVPDLSVQVNIHESTSIASIIVPALTVSNEISDDPQADSGNPLATIERPSPESAVIRFAPTPQQQRELTSEGIKGQLVVEYDVDRTAHPGEVLVMDGYFVHFFSPADLPPLRKHVTFVLDVSGSMIGRKIEQLRQAMVTILDDLNPGDLFSIVLFSDTAQIWDPTLNSSEIRERMSKLQDHYYGGYLRREHPEEEDRNQTVTPTAIAVASHENIAKAKEFVAHLEALSSTNMYDALMLALRITKLGQEKGGAPEPLIIFLTDGQPNREKEVIVTDVTRFNTGSSSVFSLALGNDADMGFLKKLSLRNSGFARKIYEASDTALQLRDLYREVASPLLTNITFKYQASQGEAKQVTKHKFRRLFHGSELVVAGRLLTHNFSTEVQGSASSGTTSYPFLPVFCPRPETGYEARNSTTSFMERLWAYLTIQQLLEEQEAKDYSHEDKNHTSPEKQRALELALQHSFVTSLTSLIVVKPNETRSVDTRDASLPDYESASGQWPLHAPLQMMGAPRMAAAGAGYFYSASSAGSAAGAFIARPAAPIVGAAGIPHAPLSPVAAPAPDVQVPGVFQPAGPISLIALNQVVWLPGVRNSNNTVTLPAGTNRTELQLELAGTDQPNVPQSPCTGPAGSGQCRHLRYCALDTFASSLDVFHQFFCQIDQYIGVCCPSYIGDLTPQFGPAGVTASNLVTVPLASVTWICAASNNTVRLPTGLLGVTQVLEVAAQHQENLTHGTCMSPEGLGFCRHLRHCALQVFATNMSLFYPQYFCKIHSSYVGVCCPLSVQW